MGTALRKLSKEKRLGGNGRGKLTKPKCKSLQNYYRGAIMDNLPNIDKIRSAIWASLFHSMSTDDHPHHQRCPQGTGSWCFYQKALAEGVAPGNHEDHPNSTFLTPEIASQMVPVYRRMSDETLLRRMTHGGTQNTNECLNSTIWARCPKTAFMGKKRVDGAAARAVSVFNEGALELVGIMNKLYVEVAYTTLMALSTKDARRMTKGDTAASAGARAKRKDNAVERAQTRRRENARDGNVYGAGLH